MPLSPPVHCRPECYALFTAQIPHIGEVRSLVRAAVALALHESPDVRVDEVEHQIAEMTDTIRRRLRSASTAAILAHAHDLLFDELGFVGDRERYDHSDNSYLPRVLQRRRGLPITLSLLYKAVVEPLGVPVTGVNAPAHFMVSVVEQRATLIIDPFFSGRAMTSAEAVAHLTGLLGQSPPPGVNLLPPATHSQWLMRMLSNLVNHFSAAQRHDDAAAMLELQQSLTDRTR